MRKLTAVSILVITLASFMCIYFYSKSEDPKELQKIIFEKLLTGVVFGGLGFYFKALYDKHKLRQRFAYDIMYKPIIRFRRNCSRILIESFHLVFDASAKNISNENFEENRQKFLRMREWFDLELEKHGYLLPSSSIPKLHSLSAILTALAGKAASLRELNYNQFDQYYSFLNDLNLGFQNFFMTISGIEDVVEMPNKGFMPKNFSGDGDKNIFDQNFEAWQRTQNTKM